MPKLLADEVRLLHKDAVTRNKDLNARREARENARWLKEQRKLSASIISELPNEIRKAACEGKYYVEIYRWSDPKQGLYYDLKGIPAMLKDWCKRNGFEVHHSVCREGHNPEYGVLSIDLDDLHEDEDG